jgi:protein TonB
LENTFLNEGVSLPNTVPPKPLEVREPEPVLDQASEAVSVVKPVLRPKIPPRAVVKPQPVRKSTPAPAPKKSVPVKPKASQASAASQTQKAAGSGGTTSAGNSNSSAATARQTKAAATALSRWYSSIRAQVERRKRGGKGSGTVGLRVTVGRTGALQSVSVGKSSGNSSLDGLALNAVKSAGRFARAPKSATNASYHIAFSMVFQ